jgi:hypothetical protein
VATEEASASEPIHAAGRYTLTHRIGAGGAGVVYRAFDDVSGRVIAFKQLLSAKAGRRAATMAALFEREYRTLVRLKHPRIIEVYDYGVTPQGPYYTMELLEGSDLGRLGRLPYGDVCRHLRDIASSLALLHAQRLVHRDVSPRNIRLTVDGTARLLDFGALAPFGSNTEIIGTPPFMAPEILHQWPLDPRTDVYSLGAVGYFCLTGRSAFAARDVNELPRLWQEAPAPPSALAPDIPPELERLILSMLSQDPLGRPETAAAVIDQLTVIGRLPPEPHEPAEQSYFLSSPIVGRSTQIERVLRRIEQSLEGKGGEVLIEGPTGIGKTRLSNELCLAGTLKGTVTLRADAESTRGSFGVAVAMARQLLGACPEIARRAAEQHVALLRTLAPELDSAFGGAVSGVHTGGPSEQRMRVHSALREWFLAVSRERALLVAVDNLHAADDDSASFVANLGRDGRSSQLFVLATLRTGSDIGAKETVRLFRERALRLKLPALDARACEQLASGLFGAAANASRVGGLLASRSGGVPRQFIELAQLMVQKKIARYEAGAWALPFDVPEHELPARSEEILAAQLSELSPDAISLARTLAVHERAVPLALALAVSELPGEGRTYTILDELLTEQVLVRDGDGYRFRHEAIHEAVLSRMDPEARRRSRRRAAEALLAFEASGVAERVEAALHLVEAGEQRRGARILVTAAREYSAGAGTHENPGKLVRALCRLVRVYDAERRSDYELGALLFPLMPLAYYSANWQFILEYGERAIDLGLRITGLAKAAELAPELGPEEALKRALAEAGAAFAEHAAEGIDADFKTAIAATIGMVPACMGVYVTCFDNGAVERIARAVAPLALFGEDHVAYGIYLFAISEVPIIGGRESDARPLREAALARFEAPAFAQAIGESRAKVLQGAALHTLALLDAYYFGEHTLHTTRLLDNLGVKAWSVSADQIRMLYHSLRGESTVARTYMEHVERSAVQGTQTWQTEMFWPALLLNADVLTSDAMGARSRYVQLERNSRDVPTLKPQAEAAHAAYLMLRGDLARAVALYDEILPSFPIHGYVGWETTRAYFARALNLSGEHARAKAIAEEVLSNMIPADHDYVAHFLEAHRQLALAESGLGNHERAAALLGGLLDKHGHESNPLLVGLLHQARAEVAERAGDLATAEVHRAEMESRFRKTQNPALIAQCENAQRSTAVLPASPGVARSVLDQSTLKVGPMSALTGPLGPSRLAETVSASEEPLDVALEFLVRRTKAKSAYLYVLAGSDLQLAWSSTNEEAPVGSIADLHRWLDVVRQKASPLVGETSQAAEYRLVALRSAAERLVIGGLIVEAEAQADLLESSDVFDAVGRAVEAHGHDALGFVTG